MGSNGMRVAILFHARERHFDPAGYLVHHLAELWRQDGLEVAYLYGTDRFVPADLVLVHVGLSVVPEPYLEFGARYPIVLNGCIRDIRKTVTSRYLVRPGDDWDTRPRKRGARSSVSTTARSTTSCATRR